MKNESTLGKGMEPWDLRITYFNVIKIFPSFYMQRVSIVACINNLYFEVCYYYR